MDVMLHFLLRRLLLLLLLMLMLMLLLLQRQRLQYVEGIIRRAH